MMMKHSMRGINLAIGLMFVILLTGAMTSVKFASFEKPGFSGASAEQIEKDLDCLAINIYREAANEPFEGKVGVAQVTLNRTKSPDFPSTVCGVVYQKNVFMDRVVCQFSWYCDHRHRTMRIDDALYEESYKVAKMVYVENFKLESLSNALYYHADYVNPGWNKKKITKIGRHIFYKG